MRCMQNLTNTCDLSVARVSYSIIAAAPYFFDSILLTVLVMQIMQLRSSIAADSSVGFEQNRWLRYLSRVLSGKCVYRASWLKAITGSVSVFIGYEFLASAQDRLARSRLLVTTLLLGAIGQILLTGAYLFYSRNVMMVLERVSSFPFSFGILILTFINLVLG